MNTKIRQVSFAATFALGGSLLGLWFSRDKALDSAPQAASSIPSNSDSSPRPETELPLQLKSSASTSLESKGGILKNADKPEINQANPVQVTFSSRALPVQATFSSRVAEFTPNADKLVEPGVLWDLLDIRLLLSKALSIDLPSLESGHGRAQYIYELLLSVGRYIATVDRQIILWEDAERVAIAERPAVEEQLNTADRLYVERLLNESRRPLDSSVNPDLGTKNGRQKVVIMMNFPSGGPRELGGVREANNVKSLKEHRISILKTVRIELASYSEIIQSTPRIQEISVTKELFPE